jgi:hypothetical protein
LCLNNTIELRHKMLEAGSNVDLALFIIAVFD